MRGLFVFILSFGFFLFGISRMDHAYFDEQHYVPAIHDTLNTGFPQNYEHPPLGKYIMVLGSLIFGDNVFGWRVMSCVFGALTVLGFWFLFSEILNENRWRWFGVILLLSSNWLLVFSRMAMLEIFHLAPTVWASFYFVRWIKNQSVQKNLWLTFAFLGVAVAIKWQAAFALFIVGLFVLIFSTRPFLFRALQILKGSAAVFAIYTFTYIAQFFSGLPGFAFKDWPGLQFAMWQTHTIARAQNSAYVHWSEWPFYFQKFSLNLQSPAEFVTPTVLAQNILYQLVGYLSFAFIVYISAKRRDRVWLYLAAVTSFYYLIWAIIPRSNLYLYYFFLTAVFLAVFTAKSCELIFSKYSVLQKNRAMIILSLIFIATGIYYYPILTSVKMSAETFNALY